MSINEVYDKVAANLQAKGVEIPQMQVDAVVDDTIFFNSEAFSRAYNLAEAKPNLLQKAPVHKAAASQTASISVAPISSDQVQRLYERKQPHPLR